VTREKLSERGLSEAKEEAAPAQRERYGFPPQSQPGATEGTVRLNVWDRDADGAALAREAPVDALSKQIPLLRDLPALGGLFRNEARGKDVSGPPGESEIYLGKKPLTPPTQPLFEEGHLRDKAAEPEIASRPLDSLILHPGLTVTGPEAEGRARLLSRGDESKMAAKKKPLTDEAQIQKRLEPAAEPAPAAAASNRRPPPPPPPEVLARDNAFSTFSLNVSDVSFKLAGASLEQGHMPDPAAIRSEEFINALDYRDPQPPPGAPVAFAYEIARDPFAQNRDLVRFAVKTAARGREAGRALNLVLLLDTSGSMERADRVRIVQEALRVLAAQLRPADRVSVVTFARTARLWADAIPGNQAAEVLRQVGGIPPEGGTNLEEAMNLAYQTASRHFLSQGANRVVLLTDGAANLGDVDPGALQRQVESYRKKGLALDCFGIGWEGYNDDLLEVLSSHGDGRYGFLNAPEETATEFAGQLAGALQVAAADVKVQVEFNPARVIAYRQVGYAKHQLAKEQFRDNTVDAAEIGAAEAGNALYVVQVNPQGQGPLATVRIRYRVPATGEYREQSWPAPYTGAAAPLEQASPALRLAAVAAAFSEWLAGSPYAGEVTPDRLLGYLRDVPAVFSPDPRPQRLEWMVRQAKAIAGR
jgi:Mg-chelatase subunit ChlD